MPRGKPHLLMRDCGIGNFGLLNGLAIEACPALFPCKNALPARNRLGVAQDTCLQESRPLARARRKELSLRDLAAKAQQQQQRRKSKKSIKLLVVSHLRRPTDKKDSSICLKKVCSSSRNTIYVLTRTLRIPFDDLRDTSTVVRRGDL